MNKIPDYTFKLILIGDMGIDSKHYIKLLESHHY